VILAIDTAGPWVAVALGDRRGERVFGERLPAALNHNEELAFLVDRILANAGVAKPELVAVDVGPGSFTGTRVGVSFAVGLAQGWHTAVYVASSFELAATCAPDRARRLAVALPIVRGSWCRATLERTAAGLTEIDLREIAQDQAREGIGSIPLVVPWGEVPGAISPSADWNSAAALLALAAASAGREAVPPDRVAVRYVGPSQAERNFRDRRSPS
jgi:tRNA threonylcarbamoyl adenosine modification protein YeaZ